MSDTARTDISADLAAAIELLERREATAHMAYREIRDRLDEDARNAVPAMSAEERATERRDLHRASARWTEAQEALAALRELARTR